MITSHGAGPCLGPPENYRYHSNPFMTISNDALLATQEVFNSFDTLSLPVQPFRCRNTLLLSQKCVLPTENRESYFQDLMLPLSSLLRTPRNEMKPT